MPGLKLIINQSGKAKKKEGAHIEYVLRALGQRGLKGREGGL